MRRYSRFVVWSSVLVVAATLTPMVWLLTLPVPPLREARLPGGTVLRLEAVSTDPDHRMVRGRY